MSFKYAFCRQLKKIFSAIGYSQRPTMSDIKTFVFLDTETTGLPWEENFKTRITELSMVAVEAEHIRLGVFPRVQNKLTFCFNPWKLISRSAEDITELSNPLLERQSKFSDKTVDLINGFLSHNPQPVCLVAHNGKGFDFPILQKEIASTSKTLDESVCYIDSLEMFRAMHTAKNNVSTDIKNITTTINNKEQQVEETASEPIEFKDNFDEMLLEAVADLEKRVPEKVLEWQKNNETTPIKNMVNGETSSRDRKLKVAKLQLSNNRVSFKLCDIYKRLIKKDMTNSHHAEGDALALIMCAATLGDEFVDWANANAKKFCDVAPLKPRWNLAYKK